MPHTSNVPSHSLIIQKIKNEEEFKLQNHNNKDAKTFLSSWFEVIFNFVQIKFRCFPCYCGLFVCLFLRVNGLRGTFLVSHSNKETEAGSPDITPIVHCGFMLDKGLNTETSRCKYPKYFS